MASHICDTSNNHTQNNFKIPNASIVCKRMNADIREGEKEV